MSLKHAVLDADLESFNGENATIEQLQSEDDLSNEEWIKIHRIIHNKKVEDHEKEKIEQAKLNKKIRQLAMTTLLTHGTVLAISLGLLGTSNVPIVDGINPPSFLTDRSTLLTFAALFGLLGAVISDLSKYSVNRHPSTSDEVSSAIHGFWATAAKYTFGATSAVILLIILYSGFLPAININELTEGIALVLAFAAGFSERLVVRAMKGVSL